MLAFYKPLAPSSAALYGRLTSFLSASNSRELQDEGLFALSFMQKRLS